MGKRFSLVIDCPMHSGGNLLSIKLYGQEQMRPLVSGSDLGATITVQVEGRLEEISCPTSMTWAYAILSSESSVPAPRPCAAAF